MITRTHACALPISAVLLARWNAGPASPKGPDVYYERRGRGAADAPAAVLRLVARLVLLATAPMSAVAALVARGLFPRAEQAALYEAAAHSLARTSRRTYLGGLRALAGFDARAALARVRCPTLVVAGADDATVALDLKEALARAIPGSRWVIVPGSGHATNADHPEAFNATLRDFLAAP